MPYPEGFLWGAAGSAHQVEGNNVHSDWWQWEIEGKLETRSGLASDHYKRYEADFELARTLGHTAPGTYHEFLKLSSISEPEGVPNAKDMIKLLLEGHEVIIRRAKSIVKATEKLEDVGSTEFIVGRINVHEKKAWMLRSMIEG